MLNILTDIKQKLYSQHIYKTIDKIISEVDQAQLWHNISKQ